MSNYLSRFIENHKQKRAERKEDRRIQKNYKKITPAVYFKNSDKYQTLVEYSFRLGVIGFGYLGLTAIAEVHTPICFTPNILQRLNDYTHYLDTVVEVCQKIVDPLDGLTPITEKCIGGAAFALGCVGVSIGRKKSDTLSDEGIKLRYEHADISHAVLRNETPPPSPFSRKFGLDN